MYEQDLPSILHHLWTKWRWTYLVVCAYINGDREAYFWLDAATHSVESKLTNRNAHTIAAQVSKAKNTLPICYNNSLEKTNTTIIAW